MDADTYWDRMTYFLDRVIPVADEYKVRMALHPNDPDVPPEGYQGVDGVLGTVEGLKKFVSINESPYHGLNFCQGTVSEMLAGPGEGDLRRDPLFRLAEEDLQRALPQHPGPSRRFRRGLPDEGDIDFVKAMQVYKELGIRTCHAGSRPAGPRRSCGASSRSPTVTVTSGRSCRRWIDRRDAGLRFDLGRERLSDNFPVSHRNRCAASTDRCLLGHFWPSTIRSTAYANTDLSHVADCGRSVPPQWLAQRDGSGRVAHSGGR